MRWTFTRCATFDEILHNKHFFRFNIHRICHRDVRIYSVYIINKLHFNENYAHFVIFHRFYSKTRTIHYLICLLVCFKWIFVCTRLLIRVTMFSFSISGLSCSLHESSEIAWDPKKKSAHYSFANEKHS